MRQLTVLAALCGALLAAPIMGLAQTRMTPTAPGTHGDPKWQGVLRASDGRTFVTDGGLAVDTALAKPSALPQRELPAKLLENYFATQHTDECGLDDLRRHASGKTYTSPSGLALNATYVDFLRRVAPSAALRFRMADRLKPIVVFADGKAVAVLMAVAQ
jgi:hypothetical protein